MTKVFFVGKMYGDDVEYVIGTTDNEVARVRYLETIEGEVECWYDGVESEVSLFSVDLSDVEVDMVNKIESKLDLNGCNADVESANEFISKVFFSGKAYIIDSCNSGSYAAVKEEILDEIDDVTLRRIDDKLQAKII
jgi:hypothetical protein